MVKIQHNVKNNQFVVTIPNDVAHQARLKKGDRVYIDVNRDGEIRLRKAKDE